MQLALYSSTSLVAAVTLGSPRDRSSGLTGCYDWQQRVELPKTRNGAGMMGRLLIYWFAADVLCREV